MKVILLKDVQNVGKTGEVKTVSDGYGRNFLIPRGLAVEANQSELAKLNSEKKKKEEAEKTKKALKDKVKSAGNKLLDRISGRSAEKSGEKQ